MAGHSSTTIKADAVCAERSATGAVLGFEQNFALEGTIGIHDVAWVE